MKILGIDDNPDIISAFEIAFTSYGHEFTSSLDGREGLRLIRDNRYDVVLLDLAMPDFSGVDVLNTMDKEGLLRSQKVMIVSASPTMETEFESYRKMGVSEYMRKPVDLDQLIQKTEDIVLRN